MGRLLRKMPARQHKNRIAAQRAFMRDPKVGRPWPLEAAPTSNRARTALRRRTSERLARQAAARLHLPTRIRREGARAPAGVRLIWRRTYCIAAGLRTLPEGTKH